MGRKACCDKVGLKKGPWTSEEDGKLITFILNNGQCCWRAIPKLAGLMRCGKSCRLRWTNYLRPDLKRGLLSEYEQNLVIHLHSKLGNRWSKIASHLPGRTDNEIKNQWNTHIKKKLKKMGIDPLTHHLLHDPPPATTLPPQEPAAEETPPPGYNIHGSAEIPQVSNDDFCVDEMKIPVITGPDHEIDAISGSGQENIFTAATPLSSSSSSSSLNYLYDCDYNNYMAVEERDGVDHTPALEDYYGQIMNDSIWEDGYRGLELMFSMNYEQNYSYDVAYEI